MTDVWEKGQRMLCNSFDIACTPQMRDEQLLKRLENSVQTFGDTVGSIRMHLGTEGFSASMSGNEDKIAASESAQDRFYNIEELEKFSQDVRKFSKGLSVNNLSDQDRTMASYYKKYMDHQTYNLLRDAKQTWETHYGENYLTQDQNEILKQAPPLPSPPLLETKNLPIPPARML